MEAIYELLHNPMIMMGFAVFLAIIGGILYVKWWRPRTTGPEQYAKKGQNIQDVLMRNAEGRIYDTKLLIEDNYLVDKSKANEKGFFLLPKAKRWVKGRESVTKLVLEEQSMLPWQFGDGTDRSEQIKWALPFVDQLAVSKAYGTVFLVPEQERHDRMLQLLGMGFLSLLVGVLLMGIVAFVMNIIG
jgi:hypothetical protein